MIGKTLAHYEIVDMLGKGGMGEVFRARDTKLGREVAIKVLPPDLASDAERLARFRREAQVLASLNHPNIAGIFGLEEAEGQSFLVMELAEGEDLSDRIQRGALPLDDALSFASQIAEGLEEAHEKGIVHRDLKPANVMVSPEGKVKVLDFGLARAYVGDTASEGDPALSPTITAAMTQAGVILGSAAYMSPEQAKGRAVDRRTDIWAFGVVLFEMITGRTLFTGETVSETMASVLKDPVDWDQLPNDLPAPVRALLERCLEKDPLLRLRDIGEARVHLRDPSGSVLLHASSVATATPDIPSSRSRGWVPWALFALAGAAAILFWLRGAGTPEVPSPLGLIRASIEAPSEAGFHLTGATPAPMVVSPTGTHLAFGARGEDGRQQLWVRHLDSARALVLPETEGAQYPFWSPDGRFIAYFANAALRAIDLEGRTSREITHAPNGKGGCWLPDGTILFAADAGSGISRVNSQGGEATLITRIEDEPRANSHRLPHALPGDRHFLFTARKRNFSAEAPLTVMIGSLDGEPSRELMPASGQAQYALGHLLYLDGNRLFARPFDPDRLEFTGSPTTLADRVGSIPGAALALFSASDSGVLTYHPGEGESMEIRLVWYDANGTRLEPMGESAGFGLFDLSPDGKRIAFAAYDNQLGTGDLFLHEVESGVRTRLTFDPEDESRPVWSPSGRTLYYLRQDDEGTAIMAVEPEERAEPRTILNFETIGELNDVSPDGQTLLFVESTGGNTAARAYLVPVDGSAEPELIDTTAEVMSRPLFSPDGQWIAYVLREADGFRIYLKTFPLSGRKWQLTSQESFFFDWDPSGNRIYHQAGGTELYATPVDLSGETPRVGQTAVQTDEFPSAASSFHNFAVSPDGSRFLVSDAGSTKDDRPAQIIIGWPKILD